jgi:hypothetical protein
MELIPRLIPNAEIPPGQWAGTCRDALDLIERTRPTEFWIWIDLFPLDGSTRVAAMITRTMAIEILQHADRIPRVSVAVDREGSCLIGTTQRDALSPFTGGK